MWRYGAVVLLGCVLWADHPRWERYLEAARPTAITSKPLFPPFLLAERVFETPFANINLIEPEQDNSPMQNESSIAVNPRNPQQLIASAVDYRANQSAWVYVSTDGGKTWRNVNLGKPNFPRWTAGNDPSVAWGPDGTAYVVYGAFDRSSPPTGENAVLLARSTDGGQTWQAHLPIILHRGVMTADSAFEDKYYISVDHSSTSPYRGRLYVPWKRVIDRDSSTQIVVTWSDDRGTTWHEPVRVSPVLPGTSLDTTFGQSFPLAATGPNGEVYVVWNSGTQRSIGFARSTDGGRTWSAPRLIHTYQWLGQTRFTGTQYNHTLKGGTRAETYPALVVDTVPGSPRRGWLYLTWAADPVPNVYFSRSTDGGQTWSTPRIIHRDTTNDQFWQWIALDGTSGDLAVMWLDSRDDPDNRYSRVYVAYSSDGGDTWLERPVTDTAFDIRRNPFTGGGITGVFAGDYNGCAFWNGIIYPSSVDMRNAEVNIFDSDVYSARISVRAPEPVRAFRAQTVPSDPRRIELSWQPPRQRSFGQPLSPGEVVLSLYRNDTLIAQLPGAATAYTDANLPPYSVHRYAILAVAGRDTSSPRTAFGYAGGARQPAPPQLVEVRNERSTRNDATIVATLPTQRADGATPLVNLARVAVLLDGMEHSLHTVSSSDTGQTVELAVTAPERGYWRVQLCVLDSDGNRSDTTTPVVTYIGPVESRYSDSFDEPRLRRYWTRGGWGLTDEFSFSAPNSLTESPRRQYSASARDTLLLFPIRAERDTLLVAFYTAAFVEERDSALVEYTTDGSQWQRALAFNRAQYPEWTDGVRSATDWKFASVAIPVANPPVDVTLRFRFRSNLSGQDDGWYIDDLTISGAAQTSADESSAAVTLFPNPATGVAIVEGIAPTAQVTVVALSGQQWSVPVEPVASGLALDLRPLPRGTYFVRLYDGMRIHVLRCVRIDP
ncbi:MAG: T9SS type A sorting domain-containing protein [Bacteroidota bacterium]|nr:T9SS type A sorting domain-containing protein [Bacteroidota bacterium]